ncbi:hypothetical protein Nepgr_016557 [Nepenthes gracilis]|uniref:Uncharacterized protein n=1 Tax=Nepenthes gracilis TaxID=150966 RepID=A0AAD3XSG0_NEPGR|nr:hypothetical protein Nepgr_016557 [Nepenthes gracilis]
MPKNYSRELWTAREIHDLSSEYGAIDGSKSRSCACRISVKVESSRKAKIDLATSTSRIMEGLVLRKTERTTQAGKKQSKRQKLLRRDLCLYDS